jgi:hypothetical protein
MHSHAELDVIKLNVCVLRVFFMQGRVVVTSIGVGCQGYNCVPFATAEAGFTVFSDVATTATNVSAYHVQSIWVSQADVLATPRQDISN